MTEEWTQTHDLANGLPNLAWYPREERGEEKGKKGEERRKRRVGKKV